MISRKHYNLIPHTSGLAQFYLEKENETGNVSYDSDNHQMMVKTRAEKVERIADFIPDQQLDSGAQQAKILVLGWGSTYGAIKSAIKELLAEGKSVAHAHLRYIVPFPNNLGKFLEGYDHIVIPEINNGQLIKLIRDKYLVDAKGLNKIKGTPFQSREIKNHLLDLLNGD